MTKYPEISEMVGQTFERVRQNHGALEFITASGKTYTFAHEQDCCESVGIESIVGDLTNLEGVPLLMADESSSSERPADVAKPEYEPESQTWTFYKFGTLKGYVDVRWLGESNGYYGEGVALRVS